jgi:hypothetical protein
MKAASLAAVTVLIQALAVSSPANAAPQCHWTACTFTPKCALGMEQAKFRFCNRTAGVGRLLCCPWGAEDIVVPPWPGPRKKLPLPR